MQPQRVEWVSLYWKSLAAILVLLGIAFLGGCGSDEEDPASIAGGRARQSQDATETFDGTAQGSVKCSFKLVKLVTGKDAACGNKNAHYWPIGMAADDCHGWRALAPSGELHDNSAKAIGCAAGGAFTFTQYAGNINCSGDGVVKSFEADKCEQDIPPVLYTKAVDLTCCTAPDSPECKAGVPSVDVDGAIIYLNGQACE